MLYIKIKCKIHMLEHPDRMMNVSSHGKKKAKEHLEKSNTRTKPVTEQLQKVTISQMRKSSTAAENKHVVKTSRVTLTAQNTSEILKESGLFVYLCKIYTQIHMYICTHRHYCTYVYALIHTTALQLLSASDAGCKQEPCSCAKLHFCV